MILADVVIVGAGPTGLFQVFELGLQGISTHVIDSLEAPGGQCTELYPDKPIYDIPAIPVCSAEELIGNLLQQIKPFSPQFHFSQEAVSLQQLPDGDYRLTTAKGLEFKTKAVVLASGAGSFSPVKLRVEGIDVFTDSQLFYRIKKPEMHKGKDIVLLGGGDSALDWALELYKEAKSLTLINRTEKFRAAAQSVSKLNQLRAAGKINVLFGRVTEFDAIDENLAGLTVTINDEQRSKKNIAVDHLLVFFGMSPKIGALKEWGIELQRNLVTVDTEKFSSSLPGVYAIGDINTYPGKKRLILSGFHEAALAAFAIKDQLEPDKKHPVQYTTTSPLMLERLGVGAE